MSLADPPDPPQLPLDLGMHVLSFLSAEERTQARVVCPGWRSRLDEQHDALRTARLVERFGDAASAFFAAVVGGGARDADRLLRVPGVDAAARDNEAIRLAAFNGHLAVVERLLEAPGVDAADRDNEAIRWASTNGHLAVVERLLQAPGVERLRKVLTSPVQTVRARAGTWRPQRSRTRQAGEEPTAKRPREAAAGGETVCVGVVFSVEGCDYTPAAVPVFVPAAKELGSADQLSPLQKTVHSLYHKRTYSATLMPVEWLEDSETDLRSMRVLYEKALDQQMGVYHPWTKAPESVTELNAEWLHYALHGHEGDGGVAPPGIAWVISFEIPRE